MIGQSTDHERKGRSLLVTVECVSLEWHGCRDSMWYVIDLDVLIGN